MQKKSRFHTTFQVWILHEQLYWRQTECILRRGFETDRMQSQNVNTGSKELPEWKVGGYIISTTQAYIIKYAIETTRIQINRSFKCV
jgi:hypothetical protein